MSNGQGNAADAPEWCVSVVYECPFFAPVQWFRHRLGRELERPVFEVICAAIA